MLSGNNDQPDNLMGQSCLSRYLCPRCSMMKTVPQKLNYSMAYILNSCREMVSVEVLRRSLGVGSTQVWKAEAISTAGSFIDRLDVVYELS